MSFQLINIPLIKRVVPAGLPHPALLLLLLAGRSAGTQATWARGCPGGWVERGGLSCPAACVSLSLCWFCLFFFPLLFLLQIKAAICCDKCSHSPFPSYLLPHREALWRLTASSWGWGGASLSSGLLWLYYFKFWDGCQGKKTLLAFPFTFFPANLYSLLEFLISWEEIIWVTEKLKIKHVTGPDKSQQLWQCSRF